MARAHDLILQLPGGYDYQLGLGGKGLSVGQAQRIALARALFRSPQYLILDEPNSALDSEGDQQLIQTLEELKNQGKTILIVAHRLSVLPIVDRLMVIKEGRLVMFGPRDEVLRQIAFEEPPRPRRLNRGLPAELEVIVLRAMEKNPQERYATAREVADDLRRFLSHEPIHARRPTLLQRFRKWARRHRAAVRAALAAALLAAKLDGFRRDTRGRARGLFCNMGSCGECMVSVEHPGGGRRRVRACLVPVTDGLDVTRGLS